MGQNAVIYVCEEIIVFVCVCSHSLQAPHIDQVTFFFSWMSLIITNFPADFCWDAIYDKCTVYEV